MTRVKNELGATLVELTCALLLLGALTLLTSSAVTGARTIATKSESLYQRESTLAAARFYLRKAFLAPDTHRLVIPPRIHKDGIVRFADGKPHALMSLKNDSRPKTGSDVITTSSLYPGLLLSVADSVTGDTIHGLQACGAHEIPADTFRSFFALSKGGLTYFLGDARKEGELCLRLDGTRKSHLSLGGVPPATDHYETILPIDSDWSLFVDSTDHLRLVSFVGDQILENQPITGGLAALQMTIKEVSIEGSPVNTLETVITLAGGLTVDVTIYSRVSRTPHWNSLLWSWNES